MDYLAYLETFWHYFPYIFLSYVFLTFIPKSFRRIKKFANADYEANRYKYHRCYSPDLCCHTLGGGSGSLQKMKPRKAVTRVYPKKQSSVESHSGGPLEPSNGIKRQVQASAIQTHTHVNQIAKMFETGHANKKINRVTPTILCSDAAETKQASSRLSQLLQENIENSANLLNQADIELNGHDGTSCNWRSEPIALTRRTRPVPNVLNYTGGTSATPSTASPAASSPLSSQHSSPLASPVRRSAPLNLKSSVEDLFAAIARNAENNENFIYAGCSTLSPVTSIDDILSQRRLSRPLSAYSISDLLNDDNANNADVENFLRVLNKT